jgi:isoquinoline 1-oxidoreductase beta subunit
MHMNITRRTFTFGISAAGAGLAVSAHPLSSLAAPGSTPIGANEDVTPEITAWIKIEPDDTTIIQVARSEMGQGNFTTLPMLVAVSSNAAGVLSVLSMWNLTKISCTDMRGAT